MAIRFQCSSCSQPIEIDDVWSSKLVACPYCQNTVTAPASSTLEDVSSMPTATPIAGFQGSQDYAGNMTGHPQVSMRRSRLGLIAIILASVSLVMMISYFSICAAHIEQLNSFNAKMNELLQQDIDFYTASQRATSELFQAGEGGVPPTWIFMAGLFVLGSGMAWLSAITCAFIALRKPANRKQAFIALGMCMVILVLVLYPG